MKIHKKGICGGKSLSKMPGEKSFLVGIEHFFCLGELNLDDTMASGWVCVHFERWVWVDVSEFSIYGQEGWANVGWFPWVRLI